MTLPPSSVQKDVENSLKCHGADWAPLAGGQTNLTWLIETPQGARVVKLYRRDDNPLFPNSALSEQLMLTYLAATELSPQFCDALETEAGSVLIYSHLDGDVWNKNASLAGSGLAALHRTTAPSVLRKLEGGSQAIRRQTAQILDKLPSDIQEDLATLSPGSDIAPSTQLVLLHGDPVPGNLIIQANKVRFIDWQCPALGDPVEDIAIFLSPAMQQIYRGAPLSEAEMMDFADAYGNQAVLDRFVQLAPWYHWRMAAYCMWKITQGSDRYQAAFHLEMATLRQLIS